MGEMDERGRGGVGYRPAFTTPLNTPMWAFMRTHAVQLMCRTQLARPGQTVYCPNVSPKAGAPSRAGVLYLGDLGGLPSECVCV